MTRNNLIGVNATLALAPCCVQCPGAVWSRSQSERLIVDQPLPVDRQAAYPHQTVVAERTSLLTHQRPRTGRPRWGAKPLSQGPGHQASRKNGSTDQTC